MEESITTLRMSIIFLYKEPAKLSLNFSTKLKLRKWAFRKQKIIYISTFITATSTYLILLHYTRSVMFIAKKENCTVKYCYGAAHLCSFHWMLYQFSKGKLC